ncbi:OmpA family protein [Desulfospira joergensenii]|uniref:OmpA family protein n=1 Tax=Desulfospira joergensenii TaxID=53329 RepID=UPI0003B7428B|nr:OmpA family protein [Desulfospira joergensenii]
MKKKFLVQSLMSVLTLFFLFGCATKMPADLSSFSAKQFDPNMYTSKVDNFLIILDASSSVDQLKMNGEPTNFVIAKAIAERMNMTIPELGQTAGLRTFGHHPSITKDPTKLFYGMVPYSTADLDKSLAKVTKPGGTSPLGLAFDAAAMDFENLGGVHNAVIVIADGLQMPRAIASAQNLKDKYGSSICIYPIQVGDSAEGEALLQEIARIGDCGFFSKAKDLMSGEGMASFVEKVFLNAKAKKMEAAPAAPAPAPKVPGKKDSDQDGVIDDEDQCPQTPMGAKVNAQGCWILDNVLFDFNKAVIKPQAYSLLDEVVKILEKNPAMSVELQGHTDNVGSQEYNMDLSMRRSNAVAKYLVDKGILRNRLATTGFGFKRPVALNGTEFGRSLNRRVEIHPY